MTQKKDFVVADHSRKEHHPFLCAFKLGLERWKIEKPYDWSCYDKRQMNVRSWFDTKSKTVIHEATDIVDLCNYFEVNCRVYVYDISKKKYAKFVEEATYPRGKKYKHRIALFTQHNNWAFLKSNRDGMVKVIKRYKCFSCCEWICATSEGCFQKDHLKKCLHCGCGRNFTDHNKYTIHIRKCDKQNRQPKKRWKDPKKKEDECKMYQKEEKPNYKLYNYHADLETIPDKNGKFICDSAGIYNPNIKKKEERYKVFCDTEGKQTMKQFVDYIMTLEGNLWFFNGSRFDNFLVLKYLLEYFTEHEIEICHHKTLIKGSTIMVLGIYTNNPENKKKKDRPLLVIKDLCRFLQGDLNFNCKGFGLPEDQWKGEFDHEKCKTWDDVIKYKEERLEYLKKDVIAMYKVYMRFSKIVFQDHKLNVCDFISIAQLAFAAASIDIAKGRLIKVKAKDEEAFREAYYGGRIAMTTRYWYSEQYNLIMSVDKEDYVFFYDMITSHLKYYDANSLYPTAMLLFLMVCGRHSLHIVANYRNTFCIQQIEKEAREEIPAVWERRLIQVDMICPDDCYIAFLMRRDENKKNEQTLLPIHKKWYAGI